MVTDDRIAIEADVVTKLTPRSVHDTTAKLTTMISAQGMNCSCTARPRQFPMPGQCSVNR